MFLQLKVIIWRSWIIRKRHKILTMFEFLWPSLICIVMVMLISAFGAIRKEPPMYNRFQLISYNSLDVNKTQLCYTPNNEFHQNIIKRIQAKLQIYDNKIKGFDSSEALLQYYKKHNSNTFIAIIFKENALKKLEYVIRYHFGGRTRVINTNQMYVERSDFQPGLGTKYYYKGLLSVQRALDMSYIEKLSGNDNLDKNLIIGILEFPYVSDEKNFEIDGDIFSTIVWLGFILISPSMLKRIVEEKYTGIKELMKMMGIKSSMLWLGWFIYGMIPMLFSVIFIVIITNIVTSMIEYTDGSILFVFLFLYCIATIVFYFFISSLFNNPTIAMVCGILIWELTSSSNRICLIFPNTVLRYGFSEIFEYEKRMMTLQWNNIHTSGSDSTDGMTMFGVFGMLLVHIILYMALTFYMDGINPGKYGVRESLCFPVFFLIRVVRKLCTNQDSQAESESVRLSNVEEGRGMTKVIEIQNLSKRYGNNLAVHDLSLNIYQNQITVLLGHDGAGKTTLMSMITGLINITKGNIKINDENITSNMGEIRKDLGLCPQHNLLFTDLTVEEHLKFSAMLKGKSLLDADKEIDFVFEKLNFENEECDMVKALSEDKKRKLCVGMAIIGASNILILDEPTSGMDPRSRWELWDLLLSWRSEKTILIMTQSMEEADALGDWIAIMAHGTLQCYGTPIYLKEKYNTGYHLSLMVTGSAAENDLNEIKTHIMSQMEMAQFTGSNGNNINFLLPFGDNMKIAELLSSLEEKKDDLKIENISVTVTTLEDFFLKAKLESKIETKKNIEWEDTESIVYTRKKLLILRIIALIIKKLKFGYYTQFTYLIVVLAACLICTIAWRFITPETESNYKDNGPELKLDLSTYKKTLAFYSGTQIDPIEKMKKFYKRMVQDSGGTTKNVKNVNKAIVNKGTENIRYYKEHMIASAEFVSSDKITITALYNAIAIHSSPISLNLVTNVIAKTYLDKDYYISASNWPLETTTSLQDAVKEIDESTFSIIFSIGCLLLLSSYIIFPHMELSTKFAQLQYMCGVKPCYYWMVNFLVDLMIYMMTVMLFLVVAMIFYTTLRNRLEFGVLVLILFMYGMAGIPFAYLFSRFKSDLVAVVSFMISGICLGIALIKGITALTDSFDDFYKVLGDALKVICIIFLPQFGLAYSCETFARVIVTKYYLDSMPLIDFYYMCYRQPYNPCCLVITEKIPECEKFQNYTSLLEEVIGLILASSFMYFVINILLDSYMVKKCCSKYDSEKHIDSSKPYDVNSSNHNTLIVKNLYKTYGEKEIVRNISFTLKDGECLGILGVNGAGKTTTCRMLTREVISSHRGSIQIQDNGRLIDIKQDEYLEKLGYCPQMDGLNLVLTGRQILRLFSYLRGIDVPKTVDLFLKIFGLEIYADEPCGHYSAGNKKKLSLAVALIGYPKCILLDEPTTGIDPASRRKIWNIIKMVQEKKKLSFILTSNSIEECEALCNNLKIMKNGEFVEEGPIDDLKKEYRGFNIKLKLVNKRNQVSFTSLNGNESNTKFNTINELNNHFIKEYGAEIKDKHSTLLHYCIKDKEKKWSTIFEEVEEIKIQNAHLIEDYVISEASLEDIFLSGP